MSWRYLKTTSKEIGDEVVANLEGDGQKGKEDNARLLILGTETKTGYRMRMTCKHPEAIAGILFNHAMKTGELNEALKMCEMMHRIAATAEAMIKAATDKAKKDN